MRSRYKVVDGAGLYFTTSTIVDFVPVLETDKYKSIITASLRFVRSHKGLKLYAYVVMHEHFHLLASADDLPGIMQDMKRHLARQLVNQAKADKYILYLDAFVSQRKYYKRESKHQVWQEGYHPQLIESDEVLEQKFNYIHYNPVRKGYVQEPENWFWSSARNYAWGNDRGIIEVDLLGEQEDNPRSQVKLGNEKPGQGERGESVPKRSLGTRDK